MSKEKNKVCKNCRYYKPPRLDCEYETRNDRGMCHSDKIVCGGDIYPLNDKLEYSDIHEIGPKINVGKNFGCIHFTEN